MGILDFFFRKPSPKKFAQIVMQAARARGHAGAMEFDEANFCIRTRSGENHTVNLHNFYRDYCNAPRAERNEVVDKYSHLFTHADIPASFEAAQPNLLPVLRAGAFLQAAQLGAMSEGGTKKMQFAVADFSADTAMLLAYDTEHLTRILDARQFETWGVSVDEATAVALDNLRDLAPEKFIQLSPTLFASDWNDAYDSSRILLPDLVCRVAGQEPVAMIPTRGRMLLSATRSQSDLLTLLDYARSAIDTEGRRVSTLMYEFAGGKAVPYVPDDETVARKLADLRRTALQEDYAEQKELLDRRHEQEGVDLFVATYMLFRDKDERMFSIASWTAGVDTLLPETDRVLLLELDERGEAGRRWDVARDDLVALAGHMMQAQEDYQLPRWRVSGFPDAATLAALEARTAARSAAISEG